MSGADGPAAPPGARHAADVVPRCRRAGVGAGGRADGGLGGVCLYGSNRDADVAAVAAAAARRPAPSWSSPSTRRAATSPASRRAAGSSVPGNAALGAVDDERLTRAVGRAARRAAAGAGVDLDLAPCADVNSDPANPVIGVRSFGADADLVAVHTRRVRRRPAGRRGGGLRQALPRARRRGVDSHLALPTVDATAEVLRWRELVPFRAAIDVGVQAVMPGHLLVPALDPDGPATVSAPHRHRPAARRAGVRRRRRHRRPRHGRRRAARRPSRPPSSPRWRPAPTCAASAPTTTRPWSMRASTRCWPRSRRVRCRLPGWPRRPVASPPCAPTRAGRGAVTAPPSDLTRSGAGGGRRHGHRPRRRPTPVAQIQVPQAPPPDHVRAARSALAAVGAEAADRALTVDGDVPVSLTGAPRRRARPARQHRRRRRAVGRGDAPPGARPHGHVHPCARGRRARGGIRPAWPPPAVRSCVVVRDAHRRPAQAAALATLAAARPDAVVVDMGWPGDPADRPPVAAWITTHGASRACGDAAARVLAGGGPTRAAATPVTSGRISRG